MDSKSVSSFKVPEATCFVDGATVTATSKDGWLHVVVEAGDEIFGYAVTVNGKDLPYQPEAK